MFRPSPVSDGTAVPRPRLIDGVTRLLLLSSIQMSVLDKYEALGENTRHRIDACSVGLLAGANTASVVQGRTLPLKIGGKTCQQTAYSRRFPSQCLKR